VDHDFQETVAPSPDVPQLAESLKKVATAIDQARALGLPVSVPEPLYLACVAIINRHEQPDGGTPTGASSSASPARPAASEHQLALREGSPLSASHSPNAGVKVDDVPLRRLIWQVINPGEEFTVADVGQRIAALGVSWPPSAVSNALGYWASRGRLTRKRKGVYSYSQPPNVAAGLTGDHIQRQEGPAASPSRATTARGEEDTDVSIQITQRKAAS